MRRILAEITAGIEDRGLQADAEIGRVDLVCGQQGTISIDRATSS
jgi:hypothetical protein